MNRFRHILRRFRRNSEGAILTEIALAIPLYVIMLMGIVEVGNFLLLHLKLQHTVVAVSDLITRDEEISETVITDIFQAVPQIMAPYPAGEDSVAIVTAISQTEDVPASIFWQRSGGGSLMEASEFGAEGEAVDLPAGLSLRDDETILASEIYYSYEPLIFTFINGYTVRKASFFRPRIGALQEIEDDAS